MHLCASKLEESSKEFESGKSNPIKFILLISKLL